MTRLQRIFADHGAPLSPVPAERGVFEVAQKRTGIVLSDDAKTFYRAFGGRDRQNLFAVDVGGPLLLSFRSLPAALGNWDANGPHPAPSYAHLDLPPRDPRIEPEVIAHKGWFPLGEINGGSTLLYFDHAPTKKGKRGQIIVQRPDPEEVFYVADDFTAFLTLSNDLLERSWTELFPQ